MHDRTTAGSAIRIHIRPQTTGGTEAGRHGRDFYGRSGVGSYSMSPKTSFPKVPRPFARRRCIKPPLWKPVSSKKPVGGCDSDPVHGRIVREVVSQDSTTPTFLRFSPHGPKIPALLSPSQPLPPLCPSSACTTRSRAASSRSRPPMVRRCACTRAGRRSTTPAHLGNFRTFLFEDLLRRAIRLAGWQVAAGHEPDRRRRQDHQQGGEGRQNDHRRSPSRSRRQFHEDRRLPAHRRRRRVSRSDHAHPGDDRAGGAAGGERRGLCGRRRLGLLRDRQFAELRQALAARHARTAHRRARGAGRIRQGKRAGLCALESGQSRKTRRPARRGIRRGDAAVPAGISNARRWR